MKKKIFVLLNRITIITRFASMFTEGNEGYQMLHQVSQDIIEDYIDRIMECEYDTIRTLDDLLLSECSYSETYDSLDSILADMLEAFKEMLNELNEDPEHYEDVINQFCFYKNYSLIQEMLK